MASYSSESSRTLHHFLTPMFLLLTLWFCNISEHLILSSTQLWCKKNSHKTLLSFCILLWLHFIFYYFMCVFIENFIIFTSRLTENLLCFYDYKRFIFVFNPRQIMLQQTEPNSIIFNIACMCWLKMVFGACLSNVYICHILTRENLTALVN